MTEHVCEWEISFHGMGQAFRCYCKNPQCRKRLDNKDAEAMLNDAEQDKLRSEIQLEIIGKHPRLSWYEMEEMIDDAYANILEGKDE